LKKIGIIRFFSYAAEKQTDSITKNEWSHFFKLAIWNDLGIY